MSSTYQVSPATFCFTNAIYIFWPVATVAGIGTNFCSQAVLLICDSFHVSRVMKVLGSVWDDIEYLTVYIPDWSSDCPLRV